MATQEIALVASGQEVEAMLPARAQETVLPVAAQEPWLRRWISRIPHGRTKIKRLILDLRHVILGPRGIILSLPRGTILSLAAPRGR